MLALTPGKTNLISKFQCLHRHKAATRTRLVVMNYLNSFEIHGLVIRMHSSDRDRRLQFNHVISPLAQAMHRAWCTVQIP